MGRFPIAILEIRKPKLNEIINKSKKIEPIYLRQLTTLKEVDELDFSGTDEIEEIK